MSTITPAALATVLAVTTIIFYPAATWSQTPNNQRAPTSTTSCLSGYSDRTYRGSRPVSRYEFAAGMNACLNQVNKLLGARRQNLATKADFQILIERQKKLNEQLRGLKQRVDNI